MHTVVPAKAAAHPGAVAAVAAIAAFVALGACSGRGDRQPSVGDSPRSAAVTPGAAALGRPLTAADAPPPRLTCAPPTRPAPIELAGSPGWACADLEGRSNGPFFTMYPDGATELAGGFRDGLLHGPWRRLHHNGKPAESGRYEAGLKEGTWQLTNESGGLLGDYAMSGGSGVEKRWYDDGQLASERSLVAGVLDGPSAVYAGGGALLYSAQYKAGALDGPRRIGLAGALRLEDQWAAGAPRGPRRILRRERSAVEMSFDDQGVLTGPYVAWRDRVTLRERGAYVKGERHGPWRWFARGGGLEREGAYAAGLRQGRWRVWTAGRLVMQGNYHKDRPTGAFTYWKATGGLAGTTTLRGGTGTLATFHDNGQRASSTAMVKGVRQGAYRELSPQGRILVAGAYQDDHRAGAWVERDAAGRLLREATYVDGKLDGLLRRYAAGELIAEQRYVAGVRQGAYRELSPRPGAAAILRITGEYKDDRKSGEWIVRSDDGRPALVEHYQDGALHGAWQELDGGAVVVRGQHDRGRRSGTWAWSTADGAVVRTVSYAQP